MTGNKQGRSQYTVFVINAAGQERPPCRGAFTCEWNWITASADWTPGDVAEPGQARWDAIFVVAQKNQENEALALCEAIRENSAFDNIPLLVAVNIYQMPLASKVKRLPNSGYIFVPIVEAELLKRLTETGGE